MPQINSYQIRFVSRDRRIVVQNIAANNIEDVRLRLPNECVYLLDTCRVSLWQSNRAQIQFTRATNIAFAHALAGLLRPGLPIVSAIYIMQREVAQKDLATALKEIARGVEAGSSLSAAMAEQGQFNPLLVAAVTAAEPRAGLADALERWSRQEMQWQKLIDQLRSALTYPAIVLAVSFLVVAFMLLFLLPKFSAIFEEAHAQLPWASVAMFKLSQFVRQHLPVLSMIGVLSLVALYISFKSGALQKNTRNIFTSISMFQLPHREWRLSRFYRSTGLLISSGVPVLRSIQIVNDASTDINLEPLIENLSNGDAITQSLARSGLTCESSRQMLILGETNANLAEAFDQVATLYENRLFARLAKIMEIGEPMLLLALSLFIGALVVLMYIPIFDLATNVK